MALYFSLEKRERKGRSTLYVGKKAEGKKKKSGLLAPLVGVKTHFKGKGKKKDFAPILNRKRD